MIERVLFAAASMATGCNPPLVEVAPMPRYTYYQHVKPILEARCTHCHQNGTFAPMSLIDYTEAKANKELIGHAVAEGRMPPWFAADGCNDYLFDISLTEEQKNILVSWGAGEGLRGDPAAPPAVTIKTEERDRMGDKVSPWMGLSRVDLETRMNEPYLPTFQSPYGKYDEGRCFLLDLPIEETTMITGMDIVPGNMPLVHHATVTLVPEEGVPFYEKLDAESPGVPGWPCDTGQGSGTGEQFVGGWVPGYAGGDYPHRLGFEADPGMKIVLNMHYNSLYAEPDTDQTSVRFSFERDYVAYQTYGLAVMDPGWIRYLRIPAGVEDHVEEFSYDPVFWAQVLTGLPVPITIFSAFVHMHVWGSSARISIQHPDGSETCVLDVPRYDYHWQEEYWLRESITLEAGDELKIECHWDNSAENQPIVDGKRMEPIDVTWGAYVPHDMCVGFLRATPF